jgi:hypothetical protein
MNDRLHGPRAHQVSGRAVSLEETGKVLVLIMTIPIRFKVIKPLT